MSTQSLALMTFNRGVVSPLALGRVDLERTRLSAETQTNWMPRALGSMSIRPGLKYIARTPNNAAVTYLDFVYSTTDTALVQISNQSITVIVDDEVLERPPVSSAIANGEFGTNLDDWDLADEDGAASSQDGGAMKLLGTGFNAAIRRQDVSVAVQDRGVRHALRIVVRRGPVLLRVGSTSGGDEYISETTLGTGTHSLAFTPTGSTFYVQFANRTNRSSFVESVAVEGQGVMTLPGPWTTAALPLIRGDQSNDVIFVACEGYQQRRIERRAVDSWSIVLYEPIDGPFRSENTSKVRIGASGIQGDITLTSTAPLFRSSHVGALFRLRSIGQKVTITATGENQWSDPIRITGVGEARNWFVTLSGTWNATVTVQLSVGEVGSWVDQTSGYTSPGDYSGDDQLDNQISFYRIGVKAGDFTSGAVVASLYVPSGSIWGVARITGFTDNMNVSAAVLKDLGGTENNDIWAEGSWSDYRGWPSAVSFYEGRLGWFGKSGVWLSISDTVDSFDPTTVGDSGPINRSMRYGSADAVAWAQAAQRLLVGTAAAELSIRSNSFDEPLTPTNYNVKPASTQGALRTVPAVLMDGSVVFVQAGGTRVYELSLAGNGLDYTPIDLTTLAPEIGEPGIVSIAVQRQPDTRIHCVRADGKVAIAVIDKNENVLAWVLFETDGAVENVVRLPGPVEDRVYYVVRRTINGQTVRYLEKWAQQSDCEGADWEDGGLVHLLDSHLIFTGITGDEDGTNIGGLSHLEGKTVACWADGTYRGLFDVMSGQITVPGSISQAIVGLPYTATYKSAKLVFSGAYGPTLMQRKIFKKLGILARNLHSQSLRYGDATGPMYAMPAVEDGKPVAANTVWADYDKDMLPVDGVWSTDSRIRLTAQAPLPATVLALVAPVESNERI